MKISTSAILTVLFAFVLCLAVNPAMAQDKDQAYRAAVEQAAAMPDGFDFTNLRDLYAETSFFEPYKTSVSFDMKTLREQIKAGDAAAVQALTDYARDHFALPEVHSRMVAYYKDLNDDAKMAQHQWALRGLIYALKESGDGASPETAYRVLAISEEYMLIRGAQFKTKTQSLRSVGDRQYDLHFAVPVDESQPQDRREMWFDITRIWAKNPI